MKLISTFTCGILLCVSASSQQTDQEQAAIAYSTGGVLYTATASGKTLNVARPDPPIGTFDFTANAKQVVFAPLGKARYGGELYLLTLSSSQVRRLTRGPYYDRPGKSDEAYADPDVAPDGK